MQNILRYLTPEILAWESGNIQEVRPLGSVLCLPDGREWYAFGFTRDAYYGSLSLLMASSRRECGEWARANSPAAIRFGAQRYLIDTTAYRMFSGNDDQLFRLPLLLRDRPPMPDWLRSTPLPPAPDGGRPGGPGPEHTRRSGGAAAAGWARLGPDRAPAELRTM